MPSSTQWLHQAVVIIQMTVRDAQKWSFVTSYYVLHVYKAKL